MAYNIGWAAVNINPMYFGSHRHFVDSLIPLALPYVWPVKTQTTLYVLLTWPHYWYWFAPIYWVGERRVNPEHSDGTVGLWAVPIIMGWKLDGLELLVELLAHMHMLYHLDGLPGDRCGWPMYYWALNVH